MNKTLLNSALTLAIGFASMGTAQAANVFNFVGGGVPVNSGTSAPTGSWFSMLAQDTNSDGIPDTNFYTAIRAAGGTGFLGQMVT